MASFNIDYPGTPQDFVTNASGKLKEGGGIFKGDSSKGTFSISTLIGKIEGNYLVLPVASDGSTPIAVTITKKPFLVSIEKIHKEIGGYF